MEAARASALRGHEVTLYEKTDKLGGHVIPGSIPDFKEEDRKLMAWYENELNELKVNVLKNKEVDEKLIQNEKPNVVFIATGSKAIKPNIEGIDSDKVVLAEDVLLDIHKAGKKIVVIGGGLVGSETALWLAQSGKNVTIVEALPDILISGETPIPHMNRIMLIDLLKFNNVNVVTNSSALKITDNGVQIINKGFRKDELQADTVVVAIGYKNENKLYEEIKNESYEAYVIGDARHAHNIMSAIWDAYEIAKDI